MRIEIKRIRRQELDCPRLKSEPGDGRCMCWSAEVWEATATGETLTDKYELVVSELDDGFGVRDCRPHYTLGANTDKGATAHCCRHFQDIDSDTCHTDFCGTDDIFEIPDLWMQAISVELFHFDRDGVCDSEWETHKD